MRLVFLAGLAVTTVVQAPFVSPARAQGIADREFAAVRPLLSGSRAKETVAYMEKFVRWPGNPGFDSSIAHVAARLTAAGYVEQSRARATDRLTYRVERYPMTTAAWEPLGATVRLSTVAGVIMRTAPVLDFVTNRNMLTTNSFSTPAGGVTAELVKVSAATPAALDSANVAGKIVMVDGRIGQLFTEAVVRRGAIGVLAYSMPAYTQPEKNTRSIQFSSIPYDSVRKAWGIMLSFDARRQLLEALKLGTVRLTVETRSRFIAPATELAVIAEARGNVRPDERFVYSAHVQEPGANDDASGVGAQLEMARTLAELMKTNRIDPKRTITMLWGQEIRVTDRYLKQDTIRLKGVRWGISLDMVGQDTEKTGGTFLIEKMPDPSAIWTRGNDKHSEWGGSPMTEAQMKPHYFNDFLLQRALEQSRATGWVVKTNPFEGGSDHTAFLNNGRPGVLFWHFTDQFYHTDGDRIEMVSSSTLQNVGVTALVSGLVLTTADGRTARAIIAQLERDAIARLETEAALGKEAIAKGGDQAHERNIITVWGRWYVDALKTASDIEVGGSSSQTTAAVDAAVRTVERRTQELVRGLTGEF
ncbi:MAG: M28 family peptidase [Gemmatimonadota bacterium]|nr:M28 family peptidase [Gemmatimonadota bacterium]